MHVTMDIPEELAGQLEQQRQQLGKIIARGLRSDEKEASALRRELVSFLGRGPQPREIVAFRPSEAVVARTRELRWRNQEGKLTLEEEAEMDDLAEIDQLVSLLKAEAWLHLHPVS